jgi:hypothetical protein
MSELEFAPLTFTNFVLAAQQFTRKLFVEFFGNQISHCDCACPGLMRDRDSLFGDARRLR